MKIVSDVVLACFQVTLRLRRISTMGDPQVIEAPVTGKVAVITIDVVAH